MFTYIVNGESDASTRQHTGHRASGGHQQQPDILGSILSNATGYDPTELAVDKNEGLPPTCLLSGIRP